VNAYLRAKAAIIALPDLVPFAMDEDAHRTRKDHSAANLGMIRRAVLNLLQQDTSNKLSIRRRKMRAFMDSSYRQALLFGYVTGTVT